MLTVVIARPPVFGARLKGFRPERALAVPGVRQVVAVDAGVAVAADGFWPAKRGRDLLQIDWDAGAGAKLSSGGLRERYAVLAGAPGKVARSDGDVAQALAGAATTIAADYEVPYLAHAPMEPLSCVVELGEKACEIWTGTQFQTVDRAAAATNL